MTRFRCFPIVALTMAGLAAIGGARARAEARFGGEGLADRLEIAPRDGSLAYAESDFEINATGFAMILRRAYSSANEREGLFGPGWSSSLDLRLDLAQPTRPVLYDEWGAATAFASKGRALFGAQTGRGQWLQSDEKGWLLRDWQGRLVSFDKEGRLAGIFNAAMAGLTLEYENGRPAALRDPYGRSLRLTTDQTGRLVSAESSTGEARRYEYRQGRLARVSDGQGVLSEYGLDARGRINAVNCGGEERAEIAYDATGRVTAIGGPGVPVRKARYSESTVPFRARNVEIADALGHVMRYRFREKPNEAQVTLPGGGAATVLYNERLLPARIEMPGERRLEYQYDAAGNVTRLVLPGGTFHTFAYTNRGELKQWTRPDGLAFTFDRTASGTLARIAGPGGFSREFGFDAKGRPAWMSEGANAPFLFTYDAHGDLTSVGVQSVRAALGLSVTQRPAREEGPSTQRPAREEGHEGGLDSSGRIGAVKPGGAPALEVAYGPSGKPASLASSKEARLALERDRRGRVTAIVDAAGNRETIERDSWGRPTLWRRPGGAETRLTRDAEGNLARITPPATSPTVIAWNERNLPVGENRGGIAGGAVEYDEFGNVSVRRNLRKQPMRLNVDPLGRIAEIVSEGRSLSRFQYGADGQVARFDSRDGAFGFGHDAQGRQSRVSDSRLDLWANYDWDANGRVQSISTPAGKWTHQYDARGRLVRIAPALEPLPYGRASALGSGLPKIDLRYVFENPESKRPSVLYLPGNNSVAYTYDARGRVASIRVTLASGDTALFERYAYDARGNLAAVESEGRTMTFRYGPENRLAGQDLNGNLYAAYEYGPDGRLLRVRGEDANLDILYDAAGQPVRSSLGRFSYDPDGNRTAKSASEGVTAYQYDGLSRLIQVLLPAKVAIMHSFAPNGWPVARGARKDVIERLFLGDAFLHARRRGEKAGTWYLNEFYFDGAVGAFGGDLGQVGWRDALGRTRGILDLGDLPPRRDVAWGLMGRRVDPRGRRQPLANSLELDALEFDPDEGLAGNIEPAGGVTLSPQSLRDALTPYRPTGESLPSWASGARGEGVGAAACSDRPGGGGELLSELAGAGAAGHFAADEGAILRYLLDANGSPGWPDVGAARRFDRLIGGRSFLRPADIARGVAETVLRDGTGGLAPSLLAPQTNLPPWRLGAGRYRVVLPTLSILPPILLEREYVAESSWRDDSFYASDDDQAHGWTGRLVARAADLGDSALGRDGAWRLLGDLANVARRSLLTPPRPKAPAPPAPR